MNALLVQPLTPRTYWGFQHAVGIVGKAASMPPLGLVTLAAQLPRDWDLKVVDLNIEPLRDSDLEWGDALLLSGMLIHADSMHEVLARAKQFGLRTVVGGPGATSSPGEFADADFVFTGEAEGRLDGLVRALTTGGGPRLMAGDDANRPLLGEMPPPNYQLLRMGQYVSMSMQYSRGCPFSCEFCDIIEMFGRVPRVKSPPQVLRELDSLYGAGWRGSVFFVDDNFIANRREVAALLPEVERWQEEHGWPFAFYTEASVDLATQPKLVDAMVAAGFTTVFLGIESPSPESLKETHKLQNLRMELNESVARITRAGLEVYAGFIVGFDSDGPGIFEVQRHFIDGLPIPAAMIGILTALPRTALWRRLEREGRLRRNATGDQFGRPNFDTALDESTLIAGYRDLLASLYSPESYYARCGHMVDELGKPRQRAVSLRDVMMLVRIAVQVGVLSPRRRHFWKLMARALRRPHSLAQALSMAVQGEHFIRYTREDVLPRLDAALADVARERAAPAPQTPRPAVPHELLEQARALTQLRH